MSKKLLFGILILSCTSYVQSEPKMYLDAAGRWVNSEGGNIFGDSRFNIYADPRFNINADPSFNINADPRFNINADPRFNINADPLFNNDLGFKR